MGPCYCKPELSSKGWVGVRVGGEVGEGGGKRIIFERGVSLARSWWKEVWGHRKKAVFKPRRVINQVVSGGFGHDWDFVSLMSEDF